MSLEKLKDQYIYDAKINELKGEISLNIDTMKIKEYIKDKGKSLNSSFHVCFTNMPLYIKDIIVNFIDTDPEIEFISLDPSFTSSSEILWDLTLKGDSEKLAIVKLLFGGYYLEEIVNIIDPNNEMHLDDSLIAEGKNSWMIDKYFGKDLKKSLIEFYKLTNDFPLKFPMHPKEINTQAQKVTNKSKFRTLLLKELEMNGLKESFLKICKSTFKIKNNELFFLILNKIVEMDKIVNNGDRTEYIFDMDLLEKINDTFADNFKELVMNHKSKYNLNYCNELLDFLSDLEDSFYPDNMKESKDTRSIVIDDSEEELMEKFTKDPNGFIQNLIQENPELLGEILNLSNGVSKEEVPDDIKERMVEIGDDKDVKVQAISMNNFLEILKKVKQK
jgi:hypothetical protein